MVLVFVVVSPLEDLVLPFSLALDRFSSATSVFPRAPGLRLGEIVSRALPVGSFVDSFNGVLFSPLFFLRGLGALCFQLLVTNGVARVGVTARVNAGLRSVDAALLYMRGQTNIHMTGVSSGGLTTFENIGFGVRSIYFRGLIASGGGVLVVPIGSGVMFIACRLC